MCHDESPARNLGAIAGSVRRELNEGRRRRVLQVCVPDSLGRAFSTYQAACAGAEEVQRIEVRVVDTRTVTLGQAMVVLEAAKVAGDDRISMPPRRPPRGRAENPCLRSPRHHGQCPKGGRIGTARAVSARFCPSSPSSRSETVKQGRVAVQRTRAGSLEYLVNKLRSAGALAGLAIAHAAAPDLEAFLDMVEGIYPRDEILVNYIGPVIGTHAGPRCLGICYRLEENADR